MVRFLILMMMPLLSLSMIDLDEYDGNYLDLDEEFSCPPQDIISPCRCHTLPPIPTVHCSGVRSLRTVSQKLDAFTYPIPYLKIKDISLMGLPSRAFSNLTITRLLISNSNLSYVAPDAFEGLETLILLVMEGVMLFDFPSVPLSRLPSLSVLSLIDNKMSQLTREDFRDLPRVRHIGLRNNRIANIERGSFPLGLVTLSLSKNHLLTLNRTVRHLPYLETLYLRENRLTSVEGELNGLFSLRYLHLSHNLLRTLKDSFRDLHNLRILELQVNSIYDLGDSFKNLDRLQALNLSHNFLYHLEPEVFVDLVSLEKLDMSGNHFMTLDTTLLPLRNLITLDLSKNGLLNFTFYEISTMVNLKVLDLDENHITTFDTDPMSSFPRPTAPLEMLFVSKNQIGTLNQFLEHFPKLQILDVSFNAMTRLWTRSFNATPKLEYINIDGNPLICDLHQMHVLHELESRRIEIEGSPNCNLQQVLL